MKTQTTFDDLVLEFPALDEKQGRELKGGYEVRYTWYPSYSQPFQIGSTLSGNHYSAGGASDAGTSTGWATDTGFDCYALDYSRLPPSGGDRQIKNWCVFKVMEVANHYYGGSTNQGAFVLAYAQNGHPNALAEGFYGEVSDLYNFANQHFNTNNLGTNVEGVKNALARNHPVMATVTINGQGHEVLITQCDTNNSYNENNKFRYYDPELADYYWADAGSFKYMMEVAGKK